MRWPNNTLYRFVVNSIVVWPMLWLYMLTFARSNYRIPIPRDVHPSEVVIFPISEKESRGIEDVRLVRFAEDDGAGTIYGTYTAYNGVSGFPSLFVSDDLKTIASHTMTPRPYPRSPLMENCWSWRAKAVKSGSLTR